jgi:branched-chain amino acid transport system ATP-binding protein
VLSVVDVTVRFGGMTAVDRVSIDAAAGEITGLIGPNGAGKTTLFDVVTGLRRPDDGTVRLHGTDVTRMAPYRRARLGLTRTFQRLELFDSLTVAENLAVAAARHPTTDVGAIVDRLGLGDVADRRADELSTGAGRLVELGRCLATKPSVLLLDEPASGQTESETRRFAVVLRELAAEGIAVVLVEHDISLVAEVCDRVIVLDAGRVIATGTPAAVLADASVQAAYLGPVTA